mgnify:CR=1 FL=1
MISEHSQWYVQKGSRVQGPFTCEEVGRFLLLGRVRNTDRVSRDGELWEPVTQVPELVPEELLDLEPGAGWQRFLSARGARDERRTDSDTVARDERRDALLDPLQRIREEWSPVRHAGPRTSSRIRSHDAASRGRAAGPRLQAAWLPWTLLGITLSALVGVLWLNAGSVGGSRVDGPYSVVPADLVHPLH